MHQSLKDENLLLFFFVCIYMYALKSNLVHNGITICSFSGVLVVNVTWRGKTYVGTLLDSTKQDWACPR